MSGKQAIENVSDTALWVAMYRAMETDRPDAHFRDPLARRLAGGRGAAILAGLPDGMSAAWAIIVRTAVFDEMILEAVRERGAQVVVNLAAGLDARPYRLELPAGLEWIEVDYPKMIDYKTEMLAAEKPRCRLERVKLDLADLPARAAFLDRVDAMGKKTLVITEGLVVYLTAEAVASLADDLLARKTFRWWLLDYASPALLKMLAKRWKGALQAAEFQFAPENGAEFFTSRGWTLAEERVPADEARRLKREFPHAWVFRLIAPLIPAKKREEFRRMSGYALLGRP
jgi:methyltransferase (TIGR00027 family)